jgi:hypothetical protein
VLEFNLKGREGVLVLVQLSVYLSYYILSVRVTKDLIKDFENLFYSLKFVYCSRMKAGVDIEGCSASYSTLNISNF